MNKADYDELTSVMFYAEIRGSLYQGKNKRIKALAEKGLVEEVVLTDTRGGIPVKLTGYRFTPAGHFAYCRMSKRSRPNARRLLPLAHSSRSVG